MNRSILTCFLVAFSLQGVVAQTSAPVKTISTVRQPVPAAVPLTVQKKEAKCREINKPKRKVVRVTAVKKIKPKISSAQN